MKYFNVVQNSEEWFKCRIGIPTSSCFSKIITPLGKISEAKGGGCYEGTEIKKFSKTAESYSHLLLAEQITGESLNTFPPTYWMERGSLLEDDAAKLYQFETGFKLSPGGFVAEDKLRWGASPDRLILNENEDTIGSIEIKCPAPWNHVENLLKKEIDKEYIPQVQGQMFCGGFDFVDWMSFHPDMPPSIIRTYRDDVFIKKLEEGLIRFDEMLSFKKDQLIEIGAIKQAVA